MPSHSKKQHNFMEAIAHSPSFAKKAGVPQSVGKDYAAADKGKTFGKGGEMKESKAMVGKEVAFMKKKGAPASMIKHEKAEMKGMKAGGKVRRYGAGGPLDEPIMTDEEYAKQKKQGAENLKSLKSFFGFKEKETPEPIERSRDIGKKEGTKTRSISTPITETVTKINDQNKPAQTSQAGTTRVEPSFTQRIADQMLDRETGGSNYGADYGSDIYSDYGDNSGSSSRTFKPIGVETSEKKSRVITAPARATAKPQNQPAKAESTEKRRFSSDSPDLESRADEMKPRRKFGLASDETRAAVRKGLGSSLDFFNLSKAHEKEFGKKMAKGGNVKKMATGGFGILNQMKPNNQMQSNNKVASAPVSQNLSQGVNSLFRQPAAPVKPAAPVQPAATVKPATQTNLKQNALIADLLNQQAQKRPQAMANQKSAFNRDAFAEPTPGPLLSATDYKKGGKVRKMAEGGFARAADGVAKKGKTQGKVVKMASGGFVKSADGCAQRGKTRGAQVKMSRGGKC